MRRRLVLAIVAVAAASVVLFALPLALVLRQSYTDEALLGLQRDAVAATRQVDLAGGGPDPIEVPRGADVIGVYGLDAVRHAGSGPTRADPVVQRALATSRPADARVDGRLVAAVPLVVAERVTGAVRLSRDGGAVAARVRQAWLALAVLAVTVILIGIGAAAIVARRLARPLEDLAQTARRLGEGDFVISNAPSRIAEVDAVGNSLVTTAHRLGDMIGRERAFSANASHQLRTPLAALRLEIEAINLRPGAPEELPLALEQIDRLESTVETLLALAHGAAPAKGRLDIARLVDEVETRWRGPLAESGRPLHVTVEPSLGAISGSLGVVSEILAVLLENALVHGAGVVRLDVRSAPKGWAAFEVSDEGVGIVAGGGPGGHGIGLPLAQSLAEAEGGRLSLTRPSPAPRFTLLLPPAPVSPVQHAAAAPVQSRS